VRDAKLKNVINDDDDEYNTAQKNEYID